MATNETNTQPVDDAMQQAMAEAEKQKQEAEKMAQEAVKQTVKEMTSPQNIAKNMAEQEARGAANRAISEVLPSEVNALRWGGLSAIPVIGPIFSWISNIKWIASLFPTSKKTEAKADQTEPKA